MKQLLRYFTALALTLALTVVSASAATTRTLPVRDEGASISVNVHTGGCTNPSDFVVDNVAKGSPAIVTIKRINWDACEAFVPGGLWIKYSKSELGLADGDSVNFVESLR